MPGFGSPNTGSEHETSRDISDPTFHYSGNMSASEDNQSIIPIILDYLQTPISLEWGLFIALVIGYRIVQIQ